MEVLLEDQREPEPVRKELVRAADYVAVSENPGRCVDDRPAVGGENLGVQLPGGALHILDLLRIAIGKSIGEEPEEYLWEMADTVYRSPRARKHHILPGVHIDDGHGTIVDAAQRAARTAGCGYDRVREEVLGRMGVALGGYQPGEHIRWARQRGWGVAVLSGEHATDATAALNFLPGKTLETSRLWEPGRVPSFSFDIWAVRVLLPEMGRMLQREGYREAADLLQKNGIPWSKRLYIETLDILSAGRIGAHDLREIP